MEYITRPSEHGDRGAIACPDFSRLVNHIPIRGADYAHQITTLKYLIEHPAIDFSDFYFTLLVK